MGALQSLQVAHCRVTWGEWLPASSFQNIQTLDARQSNIARLPAGMSALTALNVKGCYSLDQDWLPLGSTVGLRSVVADAGILKWLPYSLHVRLRTQRPDRRPYHFDNFGELIRCAPYPLLPGCRFVESRTQYGIAVRRRHPAHACHSSPPVPLFTPVYLCRTRVISVSESARVSVANIENHTENRRLS